MSRESRQHFAPDWVAPGKRQNRPYKVLELDFSGFRTNEELRRADVFLTHGGRLVQHQIQSWMSIEWRFFLSANKPNAVPKPISVDLEIGLTHVHISS